MKIGCGKLGCLVGLILLTGCEKSAPVAPTMVHGTVTFQGRPLVGGLVVFAPDKEKGTTGQAIVTRIDSTGQYRLMRDGSATITPGWYRIAIADPPEVFTESSGYPRFPNALRRPDRSGVEREVLPAKDNCIDFVIAVSSD